VSSAQGLLDRIHENVEVPSQSQRSNGFSDGILFGNHEATVTGVVTTYTPSLQLLKRAVPRVIRFGFRRDEQQFS
jgi:hypothetical protein